HRRAGATVAHRPARRRHLPRDAEGRAEFKRAARALRCRRQHADARQIQPAERPSALERENAVTVRTNGSSRRIVPLVLMAGLWPGASAFSTLIAEGQEGRAT